MTDLKVLVVDDSEMTCDICEMILAEAGFDTARQLTCMGISTFLSEYQPDVILLDLGMPGLTATTLEPIIASFRRVCDAVVLLHSAEDEETLRRRQSESGADNFIQKTDDYDAFVAAIRRAASRRATGSVPDPVHGRDT